MSDRFALYKKVMWTSYYEMDYSDLCNRVQQVDVMKFLLYTDMYLNLHRSDEGATNLKQEMEYCLFIQAV